jgi:hypothetical protein
MAALLAALPLISIAYIVRQRGRLVACFVSKLDTVEHVKTMSYFSVSHNQKLQQVVTFFFVVD